MRMPLNVHACILFDNSIDGKKFLKCSWPISDAVKIYITFDIIIPVPGLCPKEYLRMGTKI